MKLIASTFLTLGISLSSHAASYAPLVRQPLLEAPLPAANPPVSLIRGARIRYAPGQPLGAHYHPATVIGVVTEGSFRFQAAGEAERLLKAGDTFIEPAGHKILHFDNALPDKSSTITVFYLTDSKDRPLIENLDAAHGAANRE